MKTIEIKGELRKNLGTKEAKLLRKAGSIPCVIYGYESDNLHFSVKEKELKKIIYTADVYCVQINLGDKKVNTIVKDMQFHPVTDRPVHLDFLQLFDDRKVDVALPVIVEGNSVGVRNGGKLRLSKRKILLRGLPGDLPESITVDISPLRIGGAIRISDINIPGVTLVSDPGSVVVMVKAARGAVDEEEEEEGAEGAEASADAPASEEAKAEAPAES